MKDLNPSELQRIEELIERLAQADPKGRESILAAMGPDQAAELLRFAGAWGPAMDELPKGFRCGDCELLEPLGSGGFGVVYRAQQKGREVAVKLIRPDRIDPDRRARFEQERQLLIELGKEPDHGIVQVISWGEVQIPGSPMPVPYFSMPLIDGESLSAYCRRQNELADRLKTLAQVCDAVAYAHSADPSVVHGDLKPENILVTRRGKPVVMDFGLAQFVHPTQPFAALGGTVPYMAPEHFMGRFTKRADVYALGVLAFEALTDELPYDLGNGTSDELRAAIVHGKVRRLRKVEAGLPVALERAIGKALALEPAKRPSAAALAKALRAIATPDRPAPAIESRQDIEVTPEGELDYVGIDMKGKVQPKNPLRSRAKIKVAGNARVTGVKTTWRR